MGLSLFPKTLGMWRALVGLFLLLSLVCLVSLWREAPPGRDEGWVRSRVEALSLTPQEKAWQGIHWVTDLSDGLALAREHGRPVFLMANDGRIDLGRC